VGGLCGYLAVVAVSAQYVVIVSGSRDWPDPAQIWRDLEALREQHGQALMVRHGARGAADWCADRYCRNRGIAFERVRADWEAPCRDTCKPGHRRASRMGGEFCPAAGAYRNQAMLEPGDVAEVLVYMAPCVKPGCDKPRPHGSHGAAGMAALAEEWGIEPQVHPWPRGTIFPPGDSRP